MTATVPSIPDDLQRALEEGDISEEQLRQLIDIEAHQLGMSFEAVVERAQRNALPKNALGSDIQFLVMMLSTDSGTVQRLAT